MKTDKLGFIDSKKANHFINQIVAIILENDIGLIYTVNVGDFEVFEEIKAINPLK